MENEDNKVFRSKLKEKNDPIEEWPKEKLKKEASGDSDMGQSQVRDDLGIE